MMALSDGRKSFSIGLAVLIQYGSVTDTQPASHVAVAITLNAQASSLKSVIHYRHGMMGPTDGWTDGWIGFAITISRSACISLMTRDKK